MLLDLCHLVDELFLVISLLDCRRHASMALSEALLLAFSLPAAPDGVHDRFVSDNFGFSAKNRVITDSRFLAIGCLRETSFCDVV